jgi:hypothetical protein
LRLVCDARRVMVLHYAMNHLQQENRVSALPKSRLPKEFKVLPRKPLSRQEPLHAAVKADSTAGGAEEWGGDTHQRFVDAVHEAFGMWKGRDDIPRDGLEYERWVRDK